MLNDLWRKAKGVLVQDIVDTAPKARIGDFEYKVGELQESVVDAGGDKALYTLDELEGFVKHHESKLPAGTSQRILTTPKQSAKDKVASEYRDNISKDVEYAKLVIVGYDTVPKVKPDDLEL